MHSSVLKEMGETEPSGAEGGAEETPGSRDIGWKHKPGWGRWETAGVRAVCGPVNCWHQLGQHMLMGLFVSDTRHKGCRER